MIATIDFEHGLGLLVMMGAGLAGLALLGVAGIAWRVRKGRLALGALAVVAGLAGSYLALLVTVSLAAPRRILPEGETKRFCGFYLDCHLGVSVDQVRTTKSVGEASRAVNARGTFHIVTVRVSSNARAATLTPYGLVARVIDERGRPYRRDLAAERALLGEAADQPLEEALAAGDSYTRTLVFDLPADASHPALSVTEQGLPDEWIEKLLIGDEDSLLHPPTLLALTTVRDAGTAAHVR
jgi:hypothetical protein